MHTYDLTPLLRSTVGFDRFRCIIDTAKRRNDNSPSYPPYNIEKTGEDGYRITMAVAGFAEPDLEVTQIKNTLVIKGSSESSKEDVVFLHRGIARRAFERNFELADYVNVTGASIENGLLHINLGREIPEEARPRNITIGASDHTRALNGKAAA